VFPRFSALRRPAGAAAAAREAATLRHENAECLLDAEGPAGPASASYLGAGFGDADATAEFRELAESAGAVIVGAIEQRRARPDPATLLGSGKVEEIAAAALSADATILLIDHDLSPTQLRNLEDALPVPVVDRTQLILDIFARRAQTREGQLQVELAQLEYMLPRLTGRGRAMSQLGGGIGTRGPGETQLETDRRRIGRRLVILRRELARVQRVRAQQRSRRESLPVPTVALVGYTNAGKSTLFNSLTGAAVLASSRMFATLDPKLRAVQLPSRRRVLLSDTVGFIRNLPHTLVTSFRATLEEVQRAEILLHVSDAADPLHAEHKAEVEKVLGELDALGTPRIEVLNKVDLLPGQAREMLGLEQGIGVSALTGEGLEALLAAIDAALTSDPLEEAELWVAQSEGDALAAFEAGATVMERSFENRDGQQGVRLRVVAPRSLLGRWRGLRVG
jgi:GTP-binding protein HflX